jgi:hypothetical protein
LASFHAKLHEGVKGMVWVSLRRGMSEQDCEDYGAVIDSFCSPREHLGYAIPSGKEPNGRLRILKNFAVM